MPHLPLREISQIILENNEGKILLQLRDKYPRFQRNRWNLFGGILESNETPEECIQRELSEEIGITTFKVALYKKYDFPFSYLPLIRQYIYYAKLDVDPWTIRLEEGEGAKYFSNKEISELKCAFNTKKILSDFFKEKTKP